MKQRKLILFLLLILIIPIKSFSQLNPTNNILYVDKNVVGGNEDGSSWANAVPELADALLWANANEGAYNASNPLQIYVAKGSYTPKYSHDDSQYNGHYGTDQGAENTFLLSRNSKVYGGFSPSDGAEDLASRNWNLHKTILEGNGAIYHLLVASDLPATNVLDGFIIQGGNASTQYTYYAKGKAIEQRFGGGIFITNSSITIQNCVFRNNQSNLWGGAMYIFGTESPKIINSIFTNNRSQQAVGIDICAQGTTTDAQIINCSFYAKENKSQITYYINNSSLAIHNSIFYGSNTPIGLAQGTTTTNSTYSNSYFGIDSWNNSWGTDNGGNIFDKSSPFVDADAENFSISLCSEAVNAGNSASFPNAGTSVDFFGNPRVYGGQIDIGAGEGQGTKVSLGNPGIISGKTSLDIGESTLYITNGDAGGSWSSRNGLININSSGNALASINSFGADTLYYYLESGSCTKSSPGFVVQVEKPEITPSEDNVLYVGKNPTSTPNGSSWDNAYSGGLADVLIWAKNNPGAYSAQDPLKIFVEEGTYSPQYSARDGIDFGKDKGVENAFMIPKNVQLYGGFSPSNNAVDLATRNWIDYPTILDGKNEVYHVVIANGLPTISVLDGFTIQGGNASNATAQYNVYSVSVYHYRGGGIYAYNSQLTIQNCWIKDNASVEYGAGLYTIGNGPKLINNIFSDNNGATGANAIFSHGNTSLDVINNTFYNGASTIPLVNLYSTSVTFTNNIFYGTDENTELVKIDQNSGNQY